MASSRIFIKGLPPTISEDDFKKHFSAKFQVTDAKLIPHRRIGYVGYRSPEDAAAAVKYFNKSFIRMSRIGVEVARPVGFSCCNGVVVVYVAEQYHRSPMQLFPSRESHNESRYEVLRSLRKIP